MKARKIATSSSWGGDPNNNIVLKITPNESRESVLKRKDELMKKYKTQRISIECDSMRTPTGQSIVPEYIHHEIIDRIDNSHPQIDIEISDDKLNELMQRYDGDDIIFSNEKDLYMKSPYNDMLITIAGKRFRVILYKDMMKYVTNEYLKHKKYSDTVGHIVMDSVDNSGTSLIAILSYELFMGRENTFKLTINPMISLMNYDHDPAERRKFREKLLSGYNQLRDITPMIMRITVLQVVVKALQDPEIKEIWETKDIDLSNDPSLAKLVSNKKPLENIKRIYMCEHKHTDRVLERHTDKWYVKGHEVHRKNGKVFFRKGHYKGPGRDDKDNKPEPRKRVINTFGNTLDKEDLDDFYNLIK